MTTPTQPQKLLDDVLGAAGAIVDAAPGTPGAMARRKELEDALNRLRLVRSDLDVVLSAALWVDRYGRAGAPDYLRELVAAIAVHRSEGVAG